jgi:hypothetical protein
MKNPQEMWFPFQDAFKYFDTLKNYSPATNWQRFFNPQFFITYNSEDAEVENHVLTKVGSYGSQLGKIISVLDVLVAHAQLPESEFTLKPLREFRQLSDQVKEAVATIQGPQQKGVTQADVDQLIENLQSLANSNPQDYRRFVNQLKTAIAGEDTRKVGDHDVSEVGRTRVSTD